MFVILWLLLLLFLLLARFAQVQTIVFASNARHDGLGSTLISSAGIMQLLVAGVITLPVTWWLMGINGRVVLAVVIIFTWLLKLWSHRKLGGITGDIIGCISELNEILSLILISALPQLTL